MHFEIIDRYFNVFFLEIQLKKKKKLEKFYLGARVWVPKPVYGSPKQPGYVPVVQDVLSLPHLHFLEKFICVSKYYALSFAIIKGYLINSKPLRYN